MGLINKELSMSELLTKLNEDVYYKTYYEKNNVSLKDLYNKGFFISEYKDKNDILLDYKLNKLTTYLFPIEKLSSTKLNVFLLSSGGFSPVHEGHIEMMKKAKEHLESKGYNVVGGYISPSHDKYVSEKRNGEASLNIYKRIDLLEKVVKDIDWLYIDKWESCECRYEVNYTIALDRLQNYLERYYEGFDVEALFVYGSDNSVFGEVFEASGKKSVCVNRNNEIIKDLKYMEYVKENAKSISSQKLREAGTFKEKDYLNVTGAYELRNDLYESTEYLNLSKEKLVIFKDEFKKLLQGSISQNLRFVELNVKSQLDKASQLLRNVETLSLDTYFKGSYNIGVSRVFNISEGQESAIGLIGRESQCDLKNILKNIKPSMYTVVDDDIASGYTMSTLKENLPKDVIIDNFFGLNDLLRTSNLDCFDVVDIRDFIIGSENGGLLVKFHSNDYGRVPYIEPYVNLLSRANILPEKVSQFSKKVLELNYLLYRHSGIRIKDLKEINRKLFYLEGFDSDMLLEEVIKYKLN